MGLPTWHAAISVFCLITFSQWLALSVAADDALPVEASQLQDQHVTDEHVGDQANFVKQHLTKRSPPRWNQGPVKQDNPPSRHHAVTRKRYNFGQRKRQSIYDLWKRYNFDLGKRSADNFMPDNSHEDDNDFQAGKRMHKYDLRNLAIGDTAVISYPNKDFLEENDDSVKRDTSELAANDGPDDFTEDSLADEDKRANWDLGKRANWDLGKRANWDLGKRANWDLGKRANWDLGKRANWDLGKRANWDLGKRANWDLGKRANWDLGKRANWDLGKRANWDLGKRANWDLGKRANWDLGKRANWDLGKRANWDLGKRANWDLGKRANWDLGKRFDSSSNSDEELLTDTHKDYAGLTAADGEGMDDDLNHWERMFQMNLSR